MSESQKPPADELAQRLRESVRKQRPRRTRVLLLVFLLLALPFGCFVWWFWPWSRPPELTVVGFDHIAQPGKPVAVRAATQPPEGDLNRWGGQVLFLEEMTPNPADRGKALEVRTNKDGLAEHEWILQSPGPITEIEARYVDERLRPPWFSRDRIRVFTWPQNARVLAVDVATLQRTGDWPALAKALTDARSAGWQLVYLGTDVETPLAYAKLRNWVIEQATADLQPLPDGPVLSRSPFLQSESASTARKAVLAKLAADFAGPVLHVNADGGMTLQGLVIVGDPPRLKGWPDLLGALPK